MRKRLSTLACAGLMLVCAGCNSAPPLTEYANEPISLGQALTYSPVILVGTIGGPESYIGRYRQSRWVSPPAEFRVQLARVTVKVETILQSDRKIPKGDVDIYYYLWSFTGPRRLGNWKIGDRIMFFLRRENGYLRIIGDQYFSFTAIQVFSGAHPGVRTGSPASLIIDLLLSRGQRASDVQMIQAIQEAPVAGLDPDDYVRKLRTLIAEERPAVAAAACQEIKALLDTCAPPPWNFGFWQIPCNNRANMNLPCPGPCCGYGKTPLTPRGERK